MHVGEDGAGQSNRVEGSTDQHLRTVNPIIVCYILWMHRGLNRLRQLKDRSDWPGLNLSQGFGPRREGGTARRKGMREAGGGRSLMEM